MSEQLAALSGWLADGPAAAPVALPWMAYLVALTIAGIVLEAMVLVALHRRTGAGLPPRTLLPTLVAGGGLMGALLAALTGAPPICLLALFAASGVAHVVDMQRRWQTGRANGA